MFQVNYDLIDKAKEALSQYKNIYWIIGGACSGKSTVCKILAEKKRAALYDMDEYIFGKYMGRYTAARHPASKKWFTAENSLDWVLSLSWEDFDKLNKAANAEYLDLFSEDINNYSPDDLLFVDGGISYPSIPAMALPVENIVTLYIPPAESSMSWNNDDKRKPMKEMILALPDGTKKWEKFLSLDKKIAEISLKESEDQKIKIFRRDNKINAEELSNNILDYFGV